MVTDIESVSVVLDRVLSRMVVSTKGLHPEMMRDLEGLLLQHSRADVLAAARLLEGPYSEALRKTSGGGGSGLASDYEMAASLKEMYLGWAIEFIGENPL